MLFFTLCTCFVNANLNTPERDDDSNGGSIPRTIVWTSRLACAAIILVIAAWTTAKLPFYLGMNVGRKYGVEAIPMLSWHASFEGFRHTIMTSDKLLFLCFHIVLCDVLLVLMVLALLGISNLQRLSFVFFPIVVIFGLHIIPVADLVPNRSGKGFPANHILLAFLAIGVATGSYNLLPAKTSSSLLSFSCSTSSALSGSWIFLSAVLLGAPIFELLAIVSKYSSYARTGEWPPPPDCAFNATSGTVAVYDIAGTVVRNVTWPAPFGAAMYGTMHSALGDIGTYVFLVALVVALISGVFACWTKGADYVEEEMKQSE